MQKYKKVIDAVQWKGVKEGPHNLGITRCGSPLHESSGQTWLPNGNTMFPGDYAVRDRHGAFHAARRADFEREYELVVEGGD